MADLLDIRPEPLDSDQKLLRKILASLNLWLGGIVPGQSQNITIDSSGGAGAITVIPNPGNGTGGVTTADRVGGYTTTYPTAPVLNTSAYAAGDALGVTIPLTNALRNGIGTGVLQSISVYDAAGQSAAIDFLFFGAEPTSSTVINNSAVVIDNADTLKLLGKVSVAATDYSAFAGGPSVATVTNVGLVLDNGGVTTIWVVPMTQGTPTYAATSLSFAFGILQD